MKLITEEILNSKISAHHTTHDLLCAGARGYRAGCLTMEPRDP